MPIHALEQTDAMVAEQLAATTSPAAVVAARHLVRRYGEGDTAVHALRGVSVDIAEGRLTAVMVRRGRASRR